MNLKTLIHDDDAVSPVIGVILMVAITVILAAVIASFVLGLGDSQETAPNASFDFDYDAGSDVLTVTKSGGDAIDGANVYIRGSSPNPNSVGITGGDTFSTDTALSDYSLSSGDGIDGVGGYTSGDIGAGQGFEINYGGDADAYEITLVYEDGDISEELISDEGPDA